MPDIVIYTTGMCPYCVHAKTLLQSKGMSWQEKRIDLDHDLIDEMLRLSNQRSVPQIFIGEHHVGGYDDMAKLDELGQLDAMLGLGSSAQPDSVAPNRNTSDDTPT